MASSYIISTKTIAGLFSLFSWNKYSKEPIIKIDNVLKEIMGWITEIKEIKYVSFL